MISCDVLKALLVDGQSTDEGGHDFANGWTEERSSKAT